MAIGKKIIVKQMLQQIVTVKILYYSNDNLMIVITEIIENYFKKSNKMKTRQYKWKLGCGWVNNCHENVTFLFLKVMFKKCFIFFSIKLYIKLKKIKHVFWIVIYLFTKEN